MCPPFHKQELERKAKKQFKGLFDKKPGEIAEAGTENNVEDEAAGENEKDDSKECSDSDETQAFLEPTAEAPRMGWLYRFWPTGGRLFSAFGLQRCTIL